MLLMEAVRIFDERARESEPVSLDELGASAPPEQAAAPEPQASAG